MDISKIGYHFGVLNRRSQAYVTYACKPWDISYSEYVVLMELYQGDGCSQDELAKRLTADKGLVARTSKALEAKGYITRRQDQGDKRLKSLYITPAGRALEGTMRQILTRWLETITAGMDEERIAQTAQCLELAAQTAATVDITTIYDERKDIHDDT